MICFQGQLELEFADHSHDMGYQVLEHNHQSIEAGDHQYADVLHRSAVVSRDIVNNHRGEQVVVLVGSLQVR